MLDRRFKLRTSISRFFANSFILTAANSYSLMVKKTFCLKIYESSQKKKKVISVKINKERKLVEIIIEDNGVGFPENRDKLFEPYITNKTNGTGLGLSICKKIIEDHNGEINLLDSKNLGGALVRIKLFKRINQK